MSQSLQAASGRVRGATVFAYHVARSPAYGVVELDATGGRSASKKSQPLPNRIFAVTGLYFYDEQVC